MKPRLFIVVAGVLIVTIGSCSPVVFPPTSPTGPTAPEPPSYEWLVRYEVTGTAEIVDVTLSNSSGGIEQYAGETVPVEYTYATFADWFVYISAQNQRSTGSVTVKIFYRDALIESATSSGAYVVATASGTIRDPY